MIEELKGWAAAAAATTTTTADVIAFSFRVSSSPGLGVRISVDIGFLGRDVHVDPA